MANRSYTRARFAQTLYDRVKRVIPPPEWATFAEDVDAILELKRSRKRRRPRAQLPDAAIRN